MTTRRLEHIGSAALVAAVILLAAICVGTFGG